MNKPPEMTEKQLRQAVVDFAKQQGWLVSFAWTSIHSPRGYPDLTFCRERIFWVELKTKIGKVTDKQQEWIDAINATGHHCYLWRPADWPEVICRELLRRGTV